MAGYSGTPLVKKLGIKAGQRVLLVDDPPQFAAALGEIPQVHAAGKGPADYTHVFVRSRAELEKQLVALKQRMAQDGMLWVSWPKKAAKVPTDVTEDVVREVALKLGLVDVKVCAVDETWSGLKLVIPVKSRKAKTGG